MLMWFAINKDIASELARTASDRRVLPNLFENALYHCGQCPAKIQKLWMLMGFQSPRKNARENVSMTNAV